MPPGPPSIAVVPPNNMYKNIIFDWFGVVSDNVNPMYKTVLAMFAHYGAKPISFDELRDEWVQPYMDFYHKYLPNLSQEEEISFFTEYSRQFPPLPYSGICRLLHLLKSNQKRLFVLSDNAKEILDEQVKKFDLVGVFEKVYSAYDKNVQLKDLLETYHLDKSETIIIGDSIYETICGHQQGISTIGVTWGMNRRSKLLTENPTYVVDDVSQLEKLLQ